MAPAGLAGSVCLLCLAILALPANAQKVVTSFATASKPMAIAVNPATDKIYVVNDDTSGRVTVIDGATNALTTVAVGTNPDSIAVNPATNKVYVANGGSNNVTVIDGATNTTSTVAVGDSPDCVVVNSTTNKIYVVNVSSVNLSKGTVTAIDGATNVATTIAAGGVNPNFAAVDEATNRIYVLNLDAAGSASEIDGVSLADTVINEPGIVPVGITVNPATNKIYVADANGYGVTVIDGATHTFVELMPGGDVSAIAVNSVTNKIYAANNVGGDVTLANGTVTVIDGATNSIFNVPTGPNPAAVAVNSVTNKVYVANLLGGSLTVIDGATNATLDVAVGTRPFAVAVNPATNRIYAVNDDGSGTVSVIDGAAVIAPSLTGEPRSQAVTPGTPVAFSVTAGGTPPLTFQWSFNGAPVSDGNGIAGSSTATLYLSGGATAASAGAYTCTVTNSAGSATSTAAALAVASSSSPGRLINLSTRASVRTQGDILIAGFTIGGFGSKTVLVRGIGPALTQFGIPATLTSYSDPALAAPVLSLYDSSGSLITADTGWKNAPSAPAGAWAGKAVPVDATTADFAQVGAFGLPQGSADSVVKITLPAGGYTSQVAGLNNGTGIALAEIYDEDTGNTGAQLTNISSRGFVSYGGDSMFAGFVISGTTSQTVLIRASGPALATFGLGALSPNGLLPDPLLQLIDNNQNVVAASYAWEGNANIAMAASSVGAFAWTNSSSNDSAVLVTLPPGVYTAQISSLSGSLGLALVEVYLVK